jgi:CRISPR-associated protein Cas6
MRSHRRPGERGNACGAALQVLARGSIGQGAALPSGKGTLAVRGSYYPTSMNAPIVDLWFPVLGAALPADHGFSVYGALCRQLPALHEARWWSLHTVPGTRSGQGDIRLRKRSLLGLRLPADRIGHVLPLAGHSLDVGGHRIRLAAPTVRALQPEPALAARLVTIKGFQGFGPFAEAVARQVHALGIRAEIQVGGRNVITIHSRTVVGFSVRLSDLNAWESLRLQQDGLGGRRRFGCGVFTPSGEPLLPDRRPQEASAEATA